MRSHWSHLSPRLSSCFRVEGRLKVKHEAFTVSIFNQSCCLGQCTNPSNNFDPKCLISHQSSSRGTMSVVRFSKLKEYSQSPPPQTSACHPWCPCVPRWGTCPGTRCPCGDGSYHCAAGAPPACPCRRLLVWDGVPGGGGRPGSSAEPRASWVFPSNTSFLPAHRVLLWPPPSPRSHASEAERAAAIHHLQTEHTQSLYKKYLFTLNAGDIWI